MRSRWRWFDADVAMVMIWWGYDDGDTMVLIWWCWCDGSDAMGVIRWGWYNGGDTIVWCWYDSEKIMSLLLTVVQQSLQFCKILHVGEGQRFWNFSHHMLCGSVYIDKSSVISSSVWSHLVYGLMYCQSITSPVWLVFLCMSLYNVCPSLRPFGEFSLDERQAGMKGLSIYRASMAVSPSSINVVSRGHAQILKPKKKSAVRIYS